MSWIGPWALATAALLIGLAVAAAARRGGRQLAGTVVAAGALVALALAPVPAPTGKETLVLTEGAETRALADEGWPLHPSRFTVSIEADPIHGGPIDRGSVDRGSVNGGTLDEGAGDREAGSQGGIGLVNVGRKPARPRWVEAHPDAGRLVRSAATTRPIVVAGHGLDPWDAERLTAAGATILRAGVPPPPAGVRRIGWRRDLVPGEPLVVTAVVGGSDLEGATLRLSGTGGEVETALEAADGEAAFELALVPPGAGRFLFDLVLETGSETEGGATRVGEVDATVGEAAPPALLWLESAPSFETRHVKSWLTAAGGAVALRTTVSRDRHRYELHNLERVDLSRITDERLSAFDLVVVDSETWRALPRAERDAIEAAVREGEVGLVLRLAAEEHADEAPFGVEVRRIADLDHLMVRPALVEDPPEPIAIPPYVLDGAGDGDPGDGDPDPGNEDAGDGDVGDGDVGDGDVGDGDVGDGDPGDGVALVRDSAGRVLAERRRLGRGRVAVTLMSDSYRWVLEGRSDVHRAYWLSLLEAVAPPARAGRWLPPAGPLLVDEPATLTFAGALASPVRLIEPGGGEAPVPMRQHPTRPERFSATLWPRQAGWHRLIAGEAATFFYAADATAWETWRLERRRDATALAAALSRGASTEAPSPPRPWHRLFALAVLLAALAFVWIAERSRP